MEQQTKPKKVTKTLINAKQITTIQSLKSKEKKEVKVKEKHRKTITELLSIGYTSDIPVSDIKKYNDSCIQSIINSCHPDIKLLFNHSNVTEYKVTCDYLRLKLNTGIKIEIYPFKTINFTQIHKNNKSVHTIHQTRYIVRDNSNRILVNKKG